jgi:hypothetical protein
VYLVYVNVGVGVGMYFSFVCLDISLCVGCVVLC